MDNTFNNVLGVLPEDVRKAIQEAFDKKVDESRHEIRAEVETQIREEFARRFEHDKDELVEAMDRMLSDVVQKHADEQVAEVAKLKEARKQYYEAVTESREAYKAKLAEQMTAVRKFVAENLGKHVGKLQSQQSKLAESRQKLTMQFREAKEALAAKYASHLQKVDEFVVRQVDKELREFDQDHRALVETRVKLVKESRAKLKETQTKFIKESASKIDKMVTESMKTEMTQLHEDLERHRQNAFGRRIFEAVAAEFMSSYLAEGTETKKLQTVLEAKDAELAKMKTKLAEAAKVAEAATRKVKLAEDATVRTKTMNELLAPLARDKRSVMVELLETVKTEHLRSAFNKYLPTVLNEGKGKIPTAKKPLNEGKATEKRTVTVTGDRTSRLQENVEAEPELSEDTIKILRLAGRL